ncbi:hypothetical protein G3R49_18915 [Shewanella sp. WXL01]|uniref:Uncharacterized protein n=1 Tax=Shewanella maritima TaxID=2520507 RepID=A0A411PLD7_9GAMM|nr:MULTISPECIES: hypothetical protein [Shewanella]NKF52632.1 hypothetical protein [Shewanella sp. WXL01]QBF84322.1 hypothetical protein EXU30_17805 [Shewanella maritima]
MPHYQIIGDINAEILIYLPNVPIMPSYEDGVSSAENKPIAPDNPKFCQQLIALNGNHWRKILTIAAKLCAHDESQWRDIKDSLFSSSGTITKCKSCALIICCDKELQPEKTLHRQQEPQVKVDSLINNQTVWHIFAGQQVQQHFNLDLAKQIEKSDADSPDKLPSKTVNRQLLTPYLDYRQFPNKLITEIRKVIHDYD